MLTGLTVASVAGYIQETIGIDAFYKSIDQQQVYELPLFLRHGYEYHKISIHGQDVVLAINKDDSIPSPHQLGKQRGMLQAEFSSRVVFAFKRLDAYHRKKFIQDNIAFIVPQKQMYIPFLFIDLNEIQNKLQEEREKLRPASQCMLLYHIQVEPLETFSYKEIALKLGYSNMTITRAATELAFADLVEIRGSKEKNLKFKCEGRELWEASKHLLQSPIKEKIFLDELPNGVLLLKADLSALESYTDLASGRELVFAIDDQMYKVLKKNSSIRDPNRLGGEYTLEVWNYDPKLLAKADLVDPLSLYLSMKDTEDERVDIALDQLLENIVW